MSVNKKHYSLKSFHLERIKNKCITEGNFCYISEKEEDLIQQKEYLQQILASIKAIQVSFLSDTNSRQNNNRYTKNIISQMKENLSRILKQKNKKYNVLIDNYNLKVEEMQIKIFSPENKRNLLKLNSSINESFSREINEKYFNDELTQLKTMNFKLENDIQQAEYSIRRKSYLQFLIKNEQEDSKEIICKSQKEYPLVSRILHKEAVETKKFFTYIVSMKTFQNLEIDDIQNSINRLKNIISREGKIIDSQDIIKEEESSDYYSNITNAIEQTLNKTKILNNNEVSNIKVNDVSDMINSFCTNQKKLDINDFQKFLNLNMNINVNINLNKNEIISDEYANDNNNNNNKKTNSKSQKISKSNNKNKNSSTGALPQIITKTLNEKFKFMPIFINDEEVNKKEKISEFRSSMTNRRDLQKCISYSPRK